MEFINDFVQALERLFKPNGVKILSVVGFCYLASKSFKGLTTLGKLILPLSHDLSANYGLGSWAVITGVGQTIGSAFASELAEKGFNLVLIDSDPETLNITSSLINQKFPLIQIKTFEVNFLNSLQEGVFDHIIRQLEELDISILVNAQGTSQPLGIFHWATENQIISSIILNIAPMTLLSRRLIPTMLRRSNRSAIINMSSAAGAYPMATLGMYGATKAYVDYLSRVIKEEAGNKIDVISVRPWIVSSPVAKTSPFKIFSVKPESLVKNVLRKVGTRSYMYGNWRQEIQGSLGKKRLIRRIFAQRLYETEQNLSMSKNII